MILSFFLSKRVVLTTVSLINDSKQHCHGPTSPHTHCGCCTFHWALSGYCTHESTLEELAQRTVDPEHRGAITKSPPTPVVPLPRVTEPGSCNLYIPPTPGNKALAIDRYLWTVQWFIANGFYVMIDW